MPLDNYRNDALAHNTFQVVTEKVSNWDGFLWVVILSFLPVTHLLTITLDRVSFLPSNT